MIAAIADGSAFKRGRDFAAWLGLVQRQLSTGGRTLLGSMPKRDNSHLRRLFIHGACSFRLSGNHERHAIGGWLDALDRRAQERGDLCAGRQAGVDRLVCAGWRYRLPRTPNRCLTGRRSAKRQHASSRSLRARPPGSPCSNTGSAGTWSRIATRDDRLARNLLAALTIATTV